MSSTIDEILGPKGLLSQKLARYEFREQQLEMAQAVARAMRRKQTLLVEAATGTGKTLAYLVPALLSGRRVVISTGTRALQEQLFHKDIPFLAKHWPEKFKAVLLKGRRNYLCKMRMQEMLMAPRFRAPEDGKLWPTIMQWSDKTETGDRAEIPGMPDDYASWAELSISGELCTGNKCKFYESCHVTQARRAAQEADLIVVNHHLFFADLSLREGGFAEVLPDYDAVVFDEAHNLEEVASAYFGMQVSTSRLNELLNDVRTAIKVEGLSDPEVDRALKEVSTAGTSLFTLLAFGLYEGRYPLGQVVRGGQQAKIAEAQRGLASGLTALERELKRLKARIEGMDRHAQRAGELKFEVDAILGASDPRYTYFLEIKDRSVAAQAAPIDLAEIFRRKLLKAHDTLIFTSATMATNDSFDYFRDRIGLNLMALPPTPEGQPDPEPLAPLRPIEELILAPVFDYASQSLLYVPRNLPAPNHPDFMDGVVQIIEYLVNITEGRAFVLFTSYANMNVAHERLADKLKYTVLKQGQRPRQELLAAFRADVSSVLFATSSFWEGVDVEGEALQLVIIDKLPFASPGDPLTKARMDFIEGRGGNSFMELSVPAAALMLKQGFGRLIRSRDDTGIVAILDSRIATKRYGQHFIKTLPPAPVVWRAPEVKRWWAMRKPAAEGDV